MTPYKPFLLALVLGAQLGLGEVLDEPPLKGLAGGGSWQSGYDTGGAPQPTPSQQSSAAPDDSRYAEKVRPCHIICGPNGQNYTLEYFCLRGEGRIVSDGFVRKLFSICRVGKNISCGKLEDGTDFTIYGMPYTRAKGELNSQSIGEFSCHSL